VLIACRGGDDHGDDGDDDERWKMDYVNAYNIDSFRGCAIVYGHLKFTNKTLSGSVFVL